MKKAFITTFTVAFFLGISWAAETAELKNQSEKDSYSLGYQYGETFKKQGMEIDLEIFVTGIRDALEGVEPKMSPDAIRETISGLQKRVFIAQQQKLREQAARNLEEGKAFMAENAKNDGIKTLASGLQYRIVSEGTGALPKTDDTVTVNYRGTLVDGTEFDSSYKRGEPASVQVDGVIAGWTEALQMMKAGSKWELFVPAELAYGQRGMGRIPPNSTLIFEVELISVGSGG